MDLLGSILDRIMEHVAIGGAELGVEALTAYVMDRPILAWIFWIAIGIAVVNLAVLAIRNKS